jgi:AcrR family transcriptional regulator
LARTRSHGTGRREAVLEAATQLFAARGFQGTKTRHIAERAGVNEALLFRDFPSKEELYWAVLERKCRARHGRQIIESQLRAEGDALEVLSAVAEGILERNAADPSLIRLWLFSGLESHRLASRFYRTYMADFYDLLTGYVRRKTREKCFRPVNAAIAARAFVGMLVNFFLVNELFAPGKLERYSRKEASRTIARIWLGGMLAPRPASAARRAAD